MGKIFGKLDESKVSSIKNILGVSRDNGLPTAFGTNKDVWNVPFKSKTQGSYDATNLPGGEYGMSNAGGASGDGPTPGFTGSGKGVDTLNGAQGRY